MAYELKVNERFSSGIKRIALEQIDKALDNLKPAVRSKDNAVHDARVCVKKIRALLRLVKDSLGDKIYKAEDREYRDTARLLSTVRDSAAMLETVDQLTEHFSDQLSRDAFASVRSGLTRKNKARIEDRNAAMRRAATSLRRARRRVKAWPDAGHRTSIAKGLKRVVSSGRSSFARAYDKPAVETFHEWRKHVKDMLYQLRILTPLWPAAMKASAEELKTLGNYLSEDHDLAILRKRALKQREDGRPREVDHVQTETETLVALIDQRRIELQVSARTLGARIYAEPPGVFTARVEAYWQAWRSEVKVDPIA